MRLFVCSGGTVELPALVLVDRRDGGHLVVNPPREVWERSELDLPELTTWSALVAATGRAMIDTLPALKDGCVNYWEAGNWSLHPDADPLGEKFPLTSRRVHAHILGRSRHATDPSWQWGEAPRFPSFAERKAWAAAHEALTPGECSAVLAAIERLLRERYGFSGEVGR